MELPIPHIASGEKGNPVREKLNAVIDIINGLGDDAGSDTGLLSDYVYFEVNPANPNTPDIDVLLYAFYGTLRWKVDGNVFQYTTGPNGYNITLDVFDGEAGESRIDTIYGEAPVDLSQPETGIKIHKGTNAVNPVAPGLNEDEVFLGYIYVNINGYASSTGVDKIVVTDNSRDSGGYQEITGKKYFSNRVLFKQPAEDIASANNLILTDGQFFRIADTANQLQTISRNGWLGGTPIYLKVKAGQSIKHNAADYGQGNYNGIVLASGADWTASKDTILCLVYDNKTHKWEENSVSNGVACEAYQRYIVGLHVAAKNINEELILPLDNEITDKKHVFVYHMIKNGMGMFEFDRDSYEATAGTSQVRILSLPFKTEADEKFLVRYAYGDYRPDVVTLVLNSVSNTVNGSNVL